VVTSALSTVSIFSSPSQASAPFSLSSLRRSYLSMLRWKSLPSTASIRLRSPMRWIFTATDAVLTLTSGMPRWPVRGST
jgi:hypothetical protein